MHHAAVSWIKPAAAVAAPPLAKSALVASLPLVDDSETSSRSASWETFRRTLRNVALGFLAAEIAVLARFALHLPPDVLPFFLLVIAVCLVTVAAGFVGGFTTMIVGGALTWYYLLEPGGSWATDGRAGYALLGYFAITAVILVTSQLYRLSEHRHQSVALELAVQEAEHQRLFAREMSHRLKNALAIVQAVANQTFSRDTPEVEKFDGRLKALADAHSLLNEHVQQPTASVNDVVHTAIAPFNDRSNRFRISGEAMPLPDQQVVSLSLALHELGTNAVKYGALSKADGWIMIAWKQADGKLQLEWKEHDGPAVTEPSAKGFGSRLLARAAMGAKIKFERDGIRCTITSRI
jgi:two-component sensor histidine kinase